MLKHQATRPDARSESLNFNSDRNYSNHFQSSTPETDSSSHGGMYRERVFGWGWSDSSDQDPTIAEHHHDIQPQQYQPYQSHGEQQVLQMQYQGPETGRYPYQPSGYPPYAFDSDAPSMSFSMSATSYDNDTPSPSPTLPIAPHQQQQVPEGHYFCLVEGCDKVTARAACMQRHVINVHFNGMAELIDCQWQGCSRTGDRGFTRRDKMIEHMREVHQRHLPKRPAASASTRKDSAYSGQTWA